MDAGVFEGIFDTSADWSSPYLESGELFRLLIETCPDSVMLMRTPLDAPWPLVLCNRVTATMHGYSLEEMRGKTVADLNAAPWSQEEANAWLDVLRERGSRAGEGLHRRKNGEAFVIEYRTTILRICGREYYFAIDRDVSDRKRLDEELLQGRKLKAVGEMAGGIAHEFNNLLTPITLQLGTIRERFADNAELAESLKPVEEAIASAKELSGRILMFSRRDKPEAEVLDLRAVIRDSIGLVRYAMDRRISLRFDEGDVPCRVMQNKVDLNQIIMNLALNARDALAGNLSQSGRGPRKPEIVCECVPVDLPYAGPSAAGDGDVRSWYRVTVSDNGCGIDDSVRERMFEPFFSTKEAGKGTGLGLSTVWHLVTVMGGWIEVESVMGEGTKFHVFIPQAARGVCDDVPARTPDSSLGPSAGKKTARILLAEDNAQISGLLGKLLKRLGHEVETFEDGFAALERLESGEIDIVITDLNMPGASGIDVLKRTRVAGLACKVIVLGGFITDAMRSDLEALGAESILSKPFTTDEIRCALANCGW